MSHQLEYLKDCQTAVVFLAVVVVVAVAAVVVMVIIKGTCTKEVKRFKQRREGSTRRGRVRIPKQKVSKEVDVTVATAAAKRLLNEAELSKERE
jgi:peptidoglycan/LPS O-acetylase OafA/YrhL